MHNSNLKKIICLALSGMMLFTFAACGSKTADQVDDYGGEANSTEAAEGETAGYASNSAGNLEEQFKDALKWKENFMCKEGNVAVDAQGYLPDLDEMNVYKARTVPHDEADEQALVQSLFGDTAEKLEQISSTDGVEYMTLMYRYRRIMFDLRAAGYDVSDFPGFASHEYDYDYEYDVYKIDYENEAPYKWLDDDNVFIHMYKGKINDVEYGLIYSYSYLDGVKYIFLDPISVNSYFAGSNYKTLMIESSNDILGNPKAVENKCQYSPDEAEKLARNFLIEKIGLSEVDSELMYDGNGFNNCCANNFSYYTLSRYSIEPISTEINVLTFSDADYYSSMETRDNRSDLRVLRILADQEDIALKAREEGGHLFYDLESTGYAEKVTDANFVTDGYALYLGTELDRNLSRDSNYGMITVTSQGIYSVDLELTYQQGEITENVGLLGFEEVKESFKSILDSDEDIIPEGEDAKIEAYGLGYWPYYENGDKTRSEYSYVPAWDIILTYGESMQKHNKYEFVYINAMDGSYLDKRELDYGNGLE